MNVVLQGGTVDRVQLAAVQALALGLAAAVLVGACAILYRRRSTRPLPVGLTGVLGVLTVGLWLFVEALWSGSPLATLPVDHYGSGIYVVVAATVGAGFAVGGRHVGDVVACVIFDLEQLSAEGEVADLLRSARTLTVVELPETVEDAPGYEPVPEETRHALAGRRFGFPSELSDDDLRGRIESRIVTDFAVDHAAVTIDDGRVIALSVGSRPSGLGPSLPPGTAAVGVAADPAPTASPDDPVEVWADDAAGNRLVARGRLRASDDDAATVVVDEDDVDAFDPTSRYRLVTPSATPSDRHRLVSLLRSVAETTVAVTVRDSDDLDGEFVGWLPGTVLAIERGEEVRPLPDDRVTLQAGDTVFLVGQPAAFEDHEALGPDVGAGLQSSGAVAGGGE